MGKLPAFQFYTGDWLKDPQLSMCAPSTRGIWIDLLCAMHENNRSGQITGTTEQLVRLCRCTSVDLVVAIEELKVTKTANVTERNGFVTVICRRMNREYKERNNTYLRVIKCRGKTVCNADETDLKRKCNNASSSSSSSSKENNAPVLS